MSTAELAASLPVVAASHQTLEKHGTSFALAGRLLPRASRDDAAVVYAFCRLVDDAADEAPSVAAAEIALDRIDAELSGAVAARPLIRAYREVCLRREIPVEAAAELLAGVRSDLRPVRVGDDAELLRYAYRVAGTVGLMMCGVLGVRDRRAWAQAIDLGVAMQLTNICRDVAEDAGRGRVYLPESRLRAHGLNSDALLALDAGQRDEIRRGTAAVTGELLALAERYYHSATTGLGAIPLRARLAIGAAFRIYRAIGLRLQRRHGADPWHGRTIVPWRWRLLHLVAGMAVALVSKALRRPHRRDLHLALQGLPGVEPNTVPAA